MHVVSLHACPLLAAFAATFWTRRRAITRLLHQEIHPQIRNAWPRRGARRRRRAQPQRGQQPAARPPALVPRQPSAPLLLLREALRAGPSVQAASAA